MFWTVLCYRPEASSRYQLSLFSEHEVELTVPSVKHHLQVCRRCFSPSHLYANHQRAPAPTYSPRHEAGLAAEDIPLRATSRKLSPHYIGHFEVDRIISPSAVKPVLLFFHRVGDSTSGWSPNHHTCHPHLFVIQLAVLRPAYTTILRQFVCYPTSVIGNTYPVFPCALVVPRPRSSHGKSTNTIHSPHLLLVSRLISLGYQPPLFPEVEADVTVPSVQHHL